jgi:hypothetical protein
LISAQFVSGFDHQIWNLFFLMFSSYLEVVFCLQTRTTSKKTGPFSSNHGEKKMISPVSFAKHGEEKLGGSFFDCCGCNHFWLVWFACIAMGVLFMS